MDRDSLASHAEPRFRSDLAPLSIWDRMRSGGTRPAPTRFYRSSASSYSLPICTIPRETRIVQCPAQGFCYPRSDCSLRLSEKEDADDGLIYLSITEQDRCFGAIATRANNTCGCIVILQQSLSCPVSRRQTEQHVLSHNVVDQRQRINDITGMHAIMQLSKYTILLSRSMV